jgi:hypothetical protein
VYPVTIDASSSSIEPIRVVVVSVVATASASAAVAELKRAAMQVEIATAEVLQSPPSAPVYVFGFDAAVGGVLADKIVAWAAGAPGAEQVRPGLIGVIEDGTVPDGEALLAAGFDDAMIAPVSVRELAARVRAVHRRVHWKGVVNGRLRYGDLTLDLYGRALWLGGKTIPLTSIELAVLRELVKARGRPLSRLELLDLAWGEEELEVSERAVDNVILRLRRKLPRPDLIETVRSVGFRLAAQ